MIIINKRMKRRRNSQYTVEEDPREGFFFESNGMGRCQVKR